ncbi:uncharacterized protein V6R79_004030 [Siganus canaliculatus]
MSSPSSECLAHVDTCMANLCKSEQALSSGNCRDEGCQIKGSDICNMTIQAALDQSPSLRGCVCSWEEGLCDSAQALATQCRRQPVPNSAGSCLDQMTVCVSDEVCNRYLAPVLQACMTEECNHERCQQVTRQFYAGMPRSVAEMLVMCECDASDQSCAHMKTALHSGTCGDQTWICQETLDQCVQDSNCRNLLKTLQAKCWVSEEAQCSNSDLQIYECFNHMDPTLILGADAECKIAFLATLGTTLHYPCTCRGVQAGNVLMCDRIRDVFHNRSHFMASLKSNSGPSKPPDISGSEQGHMWSHDYLLYICATALLVGVVILMPLAVVSKIWMLRRKDKTKFHHPQKSNSVVILDANESVLVCFFTHKESGSEFVE